MSHRRRPAPRILGSAALLTAILALSALLDAQQADTSAPRPDRPLPTAVDRVTVQNLTPHARREWVRATVPLRPGIVTAADPVPAAHIEGHATLWQPFGGTWPDGSFRFASVLFRPELAAGTTTVHELVPGRGPTVAPLAGALRRPPAFEIEVEATVEGAAVAKSVTLEFSRMLIEGARQVAVMEARIPDTGLVAQASVELLPDQDHLGFGIGVFFSDPTTEDMQRRIDRLVVRTRGMALVVRHPGRFGCTFEHGDNGSEAVLLRDRHFADGQGIRRVGVLLPPPPAVDDTDDEATRAAHALRVSTLQAAATWPVVAAVDWRGTEAFGPYGFVPDPPAWLQGSLPQIMGARFNAFAADSARQRGGDPLQAPRFGLAKNPGQTGDQNDFGLVKLSAVAASGIASMLLEVEPSVLQEGCRPVHNFEPDGSPVLPANHPDWVVWSGRTHWHCNQSKDRLGKPCPEPRHDRQGWGGKDRQHWSSNYFCASALLGREPQVLLEIENEIRLYMAGQTVRGGVSTSSAGAPRGAGRTMRTACWLWLVSGDPVLLARMRERITEVYWQQWFGRELATDRVRPMQVAHPDARILDGAHRYWTPWQDSLAACGFEAFARITGGQGRGGEEAAELARSLARNALRHGWTVDGSGRAVIATAVQWLDGGEPLGAEQLADGVVWSYGTAFSEWSVGALRLALGDATDRGDEADAQRATDLLQRVLAGRRRPSDGWYDRLTEWDGLRVDRPR